VCCYSEKYLNFQNTIANHLDIPSNREIESYHFLWYISIVWLCFNTFYFYFLLLLCAFTQFDQKSEKKKRPTINCVHTFEIFLNTVWRNKLKYLRDEWEKQKTLDFYYYYYFFFFFFFCPLKLLILFFFRFLFE